MYKVYKYQNNVLADLFTVSDSLWVALSIYSKSYGGWVLGTGVHGGGAGWVTGLVWLVWGLSVIGQHMQGVLGQQNKITRDIFISVVMCNTLTGFFWWDLWIRTIFIRIRLCLKYLSVYLHFNFSNKYRQQTIGHVFFSKICISRQILFSQKVLLSYKRYRYKI